EILPWVLVAHLAHDLLAKTDLAMRTCANTQIVAILPVIEVMVTFLSWFRKCRNFVIPVTFFGQKLFNHFLHVGTLVFVRQVWRVLIEPGIGFERQVVYR